jgi:hypothetical protein
MKIDLRTNRETGNVIMFLALFLIGVFLCMFNILNPHYFFVFIAGLFVGFKFSGENKDEQKKRK